METRTKTIQWLWRERSPITQLALVVTLSAALCSVIWAVGDEPHGPLAGKLPSGLLPPVSAAAPAYGGPRVEQMAADRTALVQKLEEAKRAAPVPAVDRGAGALLAP